MRYFKLIFFKEREMMMMMKERRKDGMNGEKTMWLERNPVAAVTGHGCSADVLLSLIYLRFL